MSVIVLSIAQFREKFPAILAARAPTLIVAQPGTGKTYNAGEIARICGTAIMVNGGSEVDWKMLFPYRMPSGRLMLGTAMAAGGWDIDEEGKLFLRLRQPGFLILDEANRVPPELKSQFQLLGSQRAVEIPGASPPQRIELDITCMATVNPKGLGVEEMSNAELDRYDLFIVLQPTREEVAQIISRTLPPADEDRVRQIFQRALAAPTISSEAAEIIYDCVQTLASRLDASKFHKPEGIRLCKAIGTILPLGLFSPAMVFRSAVERCYPLGRQGAERYRGEFDGLVQEISATFASKLGSLGDIYRHLPSPERSAAVISPASGPSGMICAETLAALGQAIENSTETAITTNWLTLPRRAMELLPKLTKAFGAGLAMEVMHKRTTGQCERNGVTICFSRQDTAAAGQSKKGAAAGKNNRWTMESFMQRLEKAKPITGADQISFNGVERNKLLLFCSLVEPKG
jgi:hypothetical protein